MTTVWLHTHLPRLQSGDTPDVISVKVPGERIAYASCVTIRDARLIVSEAGRRRCLASGVRNVHAWVTGQQLARLSGRACTLPPAGSLRRAVYDPFKGPQFVDLETLAPVWSAPWVIMCGKDVFYLPEGGASGVRVDGQGA